MTARALRPFLLPMLLWPAAPLPGQEGERPLAERIAAVDAEAVKALVAFGKRAEGQKAHAAARRAYTLVIDLYDTEQPTARKGLGWKKRGDDWERAGEAAALPTDAANASQLRSLDKLWDTTRARIGSLHKELGLALSDEGHLAAGILQLEHALRYLPGDRECHTRLGHEEIDGFFGTTTEIAFVRRMRELLALAQELRERSYDVEELPAERMPAELKATGIDFRGARSKHFEHWVVDDPVAAAESLQWAERCYDLLAELLGSRSHQLNAKAVRWHAILRTAAQRDLMFERSPNTTGDYTVDQARMFGGLTFKISGGLGSAVWQDPSLDADHSVAHVTKRHYLSARNVGLGEGLVHATTWLLCGSTLTYYTALPKTVAGGTRELPRVPERWLELLHEEIERGQDWQLQQLPRERSDNFRDRARVKSWSFMLWLVAREPAQWHRVLDAFTGPVQDLTPELVAERFAERLGRPIGEIDAEWREWARPGSPIGRASGWQ